MKVSFTSTGNSKHNNNGNSIRIVSSNGSIRVLVLVTLLILSLITPEQAQAQAQATTGTRTSSKHNEEECTTEMDGTCTKINTNTNTNTNTINIDKNEQQNMECGLYMAESSIPHSGFGMYTAIPIKEHDTIFYGDVVIHTEDPLGDAIIEYREQYKKQQQNQQNQQQPNNTSTSTNKKDDVETWLLYSYYWQADNLLGEYEAYDVQSIVPGLGMLANSHTGLINTMLQYPTIYNFYDRYNPNHVGIGASTNYHNVHYTAKPIGYSSTTSSTGSSSTGNTTSTGTSTTGSTSTTKVIPPGSELFVQYGDSWFSGRKEKLGIIPLSNDFYKADIVLFNFYQTIYIPLLQDTNNNNINTTTSSGRKNKLKLGIFRKKHTKYELMNDLYEIVLHTVSLKQPLYNAFPKTIHDVNTALFNININNNTISNELHTEIKNDITTLKSNNNHHGGSSSNIKQKYQLTASYSVPNHIRSLEWLQQYGRCLDNIYPNRSSIDQAGMGAYATRYIANNSIVTTIPLVHLSKNYFSLYKESTNNNNNNNNNNRTIEIQGQQLLLNYVYGHRDSTLVLFPYSPISNYINHNNDSNKINVKIIWSSIKQNKYNTWIHENKTVQNIVQYEHYSGLLFDLISIKDIQPNEELFLDYGQLWQQQWEHHVQNYKPITTTTTNIYKYIPASILNKQYNTNNQYVPILTVSELIRQQQQSSATIAPLYGLYDDNHSSSTTTNDTNTTNTTNTTSIVSDVFVACYVTNIYPMVEQTKQYYDQQQKQKKMGYDNNSNNKNNNNNNNNKPKFTWTVPTSTYYTQTNNNSTYDGMGSRYPCDLIERYNTTTTTTTVTNATNERNNNNTTTNSSTVTITHYYYTVDVLYYDDESTDLLTRVTIEHIPQNAIQFVDKLYKSDFSLRNTFRHEIHIPDTIFPFQWKDLLLPVDEE